VSVFISYSRADGDFVTRLQADLKAKGILYWIDTVGITPGTPDWEEALRQAIRKAHAVVLVASPHSRQSPYVKDELRVAAMYQRTVFPLWALGKEWIDSIPLGWGGTQYLDARSTAYPTGVDGLVTSLRTVPLQPSPPAGGLTGAHQESVLPFEPRNPYKGLRQFRGDDQQDFFGREALLEALLQTLAAALALPPPGAEAERLLGVVGPSGSGKSSVVLAGLLPRLQRGALAGSRDWVYLDPLVPGVRPMEGLALTLLGRIPQRSLPTLFADLLEESGRALHLLASSLARRPGQRVVLVVDQFEELFSPAITEQERRRFLRLLVTAATEPGGPLVVVLTLRADFSDRPMQYPDLARLLHAHQQPVLPLELKDLREVIERPAALTDVQLTFEGDLVGDLLFDVQGQAGALPLLQFALDRLFQRRVEHRLTQVAYREIGGVKGALAQHAEATYAALPSDEHRRLARALFLRLISPGATEQDTTRRRAALAELSLPDPTQTTQMRQVADAFVSARLLVTNEVAGTTTVEVSHEALIREWPRLGDWLHEAREDIRLQQRLSPDVVEWLRSGKPADRLYRGLVLAEAQAWAVRNLPSAQEAAFLQASAAAREQQARAEKVRQEREVLLQRQVVRKQRYAIGLIGMLGVVVAIGLVVGLLLQSQLVAAQHSELNLLTGPVSSLEDDGPGSLRQHIAVAKPGGTITFAPALSGTIILRAPLNITKNLTIRGPGADKLRLLDQNQTEKNHVDKPITVEGGATVWVYDLTFNSHLVNRGTLTLTNSTVSGNTASLAGFGIVYGGGIYNQGTLILTTSTVSGNTASFFGTGSGAAFGGGIYNQGTLTLTNSTVSGNTVRSNNGQAFGGGIGNSGTLTLTTSTVSGNTATGYGDGLSVGGGIVNQGTLTLTNSTVSGNSASFAGGIYQERVTPSSSPSVTSTTLIFCTMFGNRAARGASSLASFEFAHDGQLVEQQDHQILLALRNSIVAGTPKDQGFDLLATITTKGYNLLQRVDPATTTFRDPDHLHATDRMNLDLSPFLDATLRSNPGPDGKPAPTPTLALLKVPGTPNPALDVIPLASCVVTVTPTDEKGKPVLDPVTNQPLTIITDHDQRGVTRPQGNGCDIGAYELVQTG
jgi:hypothetical protein